MPTSRKLHSETRETTLGWSARSIVASLLGLALLSHAATAHTQADHLQCHAMKDPLGRSTYQADLDGLARESGCVVKTPGRLLCVPTTTTSVDPVPPGGGPESRPAGSFVCYKARCPKRGFEGVATSDQFGSRTIVPTTPKLLCAPAETAERSSASTAGGDVSLHPRGAESAAADHLVCYGTKDPLAKARYTADLDGLTPQSGCRIRVPSRLVCASASKTGVTPTPPGGGPSGGIAGDFACYATRCPAGERHDVDVADQFGSRTVGARRTKLLCAPVQSLWTVDAGSLKLRVDDDPWRLRFFDGDGRPVLEEHAATLPAPTGTLGFHLGAPPVGNGDVPFLPQLVDGQPAVPPQRATGWAHATRVIESRFEGGAWIATVATNDPSGRTLTVRAEAPSDGVVAFTVTPSTAIGIQAFGIAFVGETDERFFGFGERNNAVNQSGRALEHYVGEGPYQDDEYALITAVVPKWGIRWREDATYFPVPWLLSSRGYGVLLDNDALSYHRLASESAGAWSMEVEEATLRFRVFGGPTPADVLRRFTRETGTQPRSYAPWFFGPWVQPDLDDRIRMLREADVPTSVTATYLHYLPCGAQQGQEAAQPLRTAALNAQGTAVHTYFNPMICTDYQPAYAEAQAAGALLKNRDGDDYVFQYFTSRFFDVSAFDLSAPAGRDVYGGLLREAIGHGYEGWMEDFGEYAPLDAVASDGATGTRLHNRHARDYHCGAFTALADVSQPLARFARSGWTGSAACSPIVWGGDPTTGFGFDGLESAIYQGLSMGTSGVGIWGSDIGGFFALFDRGLTDENLDRWIELGAFSPVMRTQADGIAIPDKPRPQIWDAGHLALWRRYAKLHTQLWPYIQAAAEEYYATGMPLMRHGALTHPDDAATVARDDQYMFGPSMLVAPVYVDAARERSLHVPAGTWIDWWRSVAYVDADGSFELTGATLVDGNREVTLPAPLEEIPVLVRAGSLIAMLPADVQTLAEHGDDPAIVHLSDRAGELRVLAFPRGSTSSDFHSAETLRSEEAAGEWRLTVDGEREYTIELDAALGTLVVPFVPCSMTLSDGTLESWDYDAGARALHARFRTTTGTLIASAMCAP